MSTKAEWIIRVAVLLSLLIFAFTGCVSKEQVLSDIYQHDALPASLCTKYPEIKKYGMYRRVECQYARQSQYCQHGEQYFEQVRYYCDPKVKDYLGMSTADVEKYIGELTSPKNQ